MRTVVQHVRNAAVTVAGETVEPQPGDGTDDGPTGGAPREGSPDTFEHDRDEDGRNLATEDGSGPL